MRKLDGGSLRSPYRKEQLSFKLYNAPSFDTEDYIYFNTTQ